MTFPADEMASLPDSVQSYIQHLESRSLSLSERVQDLEVELATAKTHHAQVHASCVSCRPAAHHNLPRRARGHVF